MSAAPKVANKKKKNKSAKPQEPQPEVKAVAPVNDETAAPKTVPAKGDTAAKTSPANANPVKVESKAETKNVVNVPNVVSKISEKEQARLQAQLGNMQKVAATLFTIGTQDETKVFNLEAKEGDLKKVPTAYFKNCVNGRYTLGQNQRTTKILVEGCKNSTFVVEGEVLTRTIEVWRCENCTFSFKTSVKTLQVDLCKKINISYGTKDHLGAIVWADVEEVEVTFDDSKDNNVRTGFTEMLKEHPDSNKDIDQFIIRFLEDKLTTERCIRLKNGFLSTEREAVDWEKRNENKKTQYVGEFLKTAGVHLKKSKDATKKISPNAECPCGSGKKHKKCCMNTKVLSGVEGDDKKATI